METKPCPHCAAEISTSAEFCSHCTRLVRDYVKCDACQEPISKGAKRCPYCQAEKSPLLDQRVFSFSAEVTATRLGAFLLEGNITALFRPPKIIVKDGKIRAIKWTFFTLRRYQSEIAFHRVASVRHIKGVFWGGILIETFGGMAEDLERKGLGIDDAINLAESLNKLLSQEDSG